MSIPSVQPPSSAAISSLSGVPSPTWVEVLVDCPGAQGLFTYRLPPEVSVKPGDVLSVPFGAQQLGAITIRRIDHLPSDLDPAQIRPIDALVSAGFFPATYWTLLNRVADYYCTAVMQVVRVALPPGLLTRSQRRVRLLPAAHLLPATLSPTAQQVLALLQSSKTGSYSWQYLQQKVKGATRAIQDLTQADWVESYLAPPAPMRPKQRQAVMLTAIAEPPLLTPRQQEILAVLARHGGQLWLTDLLEQCQTSSALLQGLVRKGQITIQPQEMLRAEAEHAVAGDRPQQLTPDQAQALAQIQELSGTAQVLLHGVTGSGKTEVYLQAIAPRLQQGQSTLVLVPEIGLIPQLTDRFRARFGSQVHVYHSALSDGERYDTWRQMLIGQPQIVIGTRSAVFAPLTNLGLIILDEEHDGSFKQDQPAPCYHARTVAQWRAELENCPLILGSATPSLDSWVQAQAGSVNQDAADSQHSNIHPSLYLSLPTRIHDRPLPAIDVVDMRQELFQGNRSIFSRSLQTALQSLQDKQQQGILFIHRRGHSTFVSCRSCGHVVMCPHCDVSLTYHQPHAQAHPTLRCHYCNFTQAQPASCPACDSPYFKQFGSGTQRVTQELAQYFPGLRVLRFDSDTTRTKGSHRALLTRFAAGEAELLVGTQMLTKGLDLPQVTLVGIVTADGLLHQSDYRASERTFQVLTQVAGRCGRGDRPGRVILQTYSPEHPVIEAVQQHQYRAFITTELKQRADLSYPPYGRLILVRLSGSNPVTVRQAAVQIATALTDRYALGQTTSTELLGPSPAAVERVADRYRWQILLKHQGEASLHLPGLSELRSLCPSGVSLMLDIDPLTIG